MRFFIAFILLIPALSMATVIGDNNNITVNELALNVPGHLRHIPNAVGMMIPIGCTVTHIGNGYVITAAHCVTEMFAELKNQPCPSGFEIRWGYRQGRLNGMSSSKCVTVVYGIWNLIRDFAVLKVDNPPRAKVEIDRAARLRLHHPLTLFAHPQLQPLQWARSCRAERPLNPPDGQRAIYYRCDTEVGSSGAAIIDQETGKIVGVHSRGDQYVNVGSYLLMTPTPVIW